MSKCQKKAKKFSCYCIQLLYIPFLHLFLCESYFYSAESFLMHFYFFHVSDRTLAVSIDKQSQ